MKKLMVLNFDSKTKSFLTFNIFYLNKNKLRLKALFFFNNFVLKKNFILNSIKFSSLKIVQFNCIFVLLEFLKKIGIF